MKLALSLTLSFLLFAFVTKLPLAFSDPILDLSGKPICPGGKYYIIAHNPTGGGLRLGKTGDSKCPLTVLQDYSYDVNRIPVRFSMPGTSCPFILFTGTELQIEFIERPNCTYSSKWLKVFYNSANCVGIGGPPGAFSLEKYGSGYKLVDYDARVDFRLIDSGDDEGGRRLCTTTEHEPFEFWLVGAGSYDEGFIRSVA